ncbi:Hypothetical protein CAP_2318 [Chondromyces apiculatus DSM 436]|uniref:Uncharacterized protein n=1 Tax=Chondromyces apiculatus DSM 436 TaxID=1192034 RepID=A0A017TA32_9BACT|nr:Hypothetical protein CAP_2318 [Chondromyces apiculatus DSM 436]
MASDDDDTTSAAEVPPSAPEDGTSAGHIEARDGRRPRSCQRGSLPQPPTALLGARKRRPRASGDRSGFDSATLGRRRHHFRRRSHGLGRRRHHFDAPGALVRLPRATLHPAEVVPRESVTHIATQRSDNAQE